jgi:hypothetical protein
MNEPDDGERREITPGIWTAAIAVEAPADLIIEPSVSAASSNSKGLGATAVNSKQQVPLGIFLELPDRDKQEAALQQNVHRPSFESSGYMGAGNVNDSEEDEEDESRDVVGDPIALGSISVGGANSSAVSPGSNGAGIPDGPQTLPSNIITFRRDSGASCNTTMSAPVQGGTIPDDGQGYEDMENPSLSQHIRHAPAQRRVTINIPREGASGSTASPPTREAAKRGWSALRKKSNLSHSNNSTAPAFHSNLYGINVNDHGGNFTASSNQVLLNAAERLGDGAISGSSVYSGGSMSDYNPGGPASWENVAAAAAVVAASSTPSAHRPLAQYGVGDPVLVLLKLLNITAANSFAMESNNSPYPQSSNALQQEESEDEDDVDESGYSRRPTMSLDESLVTVDPVNKFGYPAGEGHTDDERHGPYSFVLCRVVRVNFEEDERYFTVQRQDTKTSQRADTAWMEPIASSGPAIDAATRAAARNRRTLENPTTSQAPIKRSFKEHWWNSWIQDTWHTQRARLKNSARGYLQSESGFAFRFNLSGVNYLVFAHTIYLFVDVLTLAFLPSSYDRGMAILGLYVDGRIKDSFSTFSPHMHFLSAASALLATSPLVCCTVSYGAHW